MPQEVQSPPTGTVNRSRTSLLVTIFIDFLGFGIVLPTIAPLLLDPSQALLPSATSLAERTFILGLLIAAFPVAQFFGAPVLGVLSDKYGRKPVLLVSILGTSVSLALFGLGVTRGSLAMLFLARIFNGLTGGNVSTAQSAMADLSDPQSKARNFGLIGMAFGLGFVLGPYFGGKLSDPQTASWFTYATPFWAASLLAACNVLIIILWFRETLAVPNPALRITFMGGIRYIGAAFGKRDLRTLFLVVFLSMVGFTFFTQFFQVYLIERFQFVQAGIGVLYAYIGLWIAFTQGVVTRMLSRKFRPAAILPVSLLALSVSLGCLLVPRQSSLLYAVLPFVALSQGVTMPNVTALISNAVSPQDQGEILGINQSVQSIAFALPPVIAGIATGIDLRLPLILASLFCLFAWAFFFFFPHPLLKNEGQRP